MDLTAFRAAIGDIPFQDHPKIVQQKSRDHYWYSPRLKAELDNVTAQVLVTPRRQDEVKTILAAAFRNGIPVTPRGAGTGNYGQAMPLSGGVILDLAGFNHVRAIASGRGVAPPRAILAAIDREPRAAGQELRLSPSTYNTASIGGFVAGGSGGVGSIRWGGL